MVRLPESRRAPSEASALTSLRTQPRNEITIIPLYTFSSYISGLHRRPAGGLNRSRTPRIAENTSSLGASSDETRLAWRGPEKQPGARGPQRAGARL